MAFQGESESNGAFCVHDSIKFSQHHWLKSSSKLSQSFRRVLQISVDTHCCTTFLTFCIQQKLGGLSLFSRTLQLD